MIQIILRWSGIGLAIIIGIITMIVVGKKNSPLIGFMDWFLLGVVGAVMSLISILVIGMVTQIAVSLIPSYNKKMLDYRLLQMSAIEEQIEVETDPDQKDWLLTQHYKYHKDANGYRRNLSNSDLNTFKKQDWKYQEAE